MNLGLYYQFEVADDSDLASELNKMREVATRFPFEKVGVIKGLEENWGGELEWVRHASQLLVDAKKNNVNHFEVIPPIDGAAFVVYVGKGAEPMVVGLARYPRRHVDKEGNSYRTPFRTGWNGACLTGTAIQTGTESFMKAHLAAVSFLDALQKEGVSVLVNDTSGFTRERSVERLYALAESQRREERELFVAVQSLGEVRTGVCGLVKKTGMANVTGTDLGR